MQGNPLPADAGSRDLFLTVRRQYPEIYACTRQISRFLQERYGWTCTEEEELYLTMHIHRVKSEQKPGEDAEQFKDNPRIVTRTQFAGRHPEHCPAAL